MACIWVLLFESVKFSDCPVVSIDFHVGRYTHDNKLLKVHKWQYVVEGTQMTISCWRYTNDNKLLKVHKWQHVVEGTQMTTCCWRYTNDNMLKVHKWQHVVEGSQMTTCYVIKEGRMNNLMCTCTKVPVLNNAQEQHISDETWHKYMHTKLQVLYVQCIWRVLTQLMTTPSGRQPCSLCPQTQPLTVLKFLVYVNLCTSNLSIILH